MKNNVRWLIMPASFICLCILAAVYINKNTLILHYPTDIATVWVRGSNLDEEFAIENSADIETLIAMLNSLELVQRRSKRFDHSKPYIELSTNIQGTQTQRHYGVNVSDAIGSNIKLSGRYVYVYPTNYENIYYVYYVKYPRVSFQDEDNEIMQYLKGLSPIAPEQTAGF